jgi:hypothetical protein
MDVPVRTVRGDLDDAEAAMSLSPFTLRVGSGDATNETLGPHLTF